MGDQYDDCNGNYQLIQFKFPGPATEVPPVSEDSVVLLTGGVLYEPGNLSSLSSSELFPTTSGCSLPSLPAPRSRHALFTTTDPSTVLAACGGYVGGISVASCLVFDPQTQSWDENRIGQLPQPRFWQAVVTLKDIGIYMIGGRPTERTTDFLKQGSQQWVAGPEIPVRMIYPCAVVISTVSFLAIYDQSIVEYQVDETNPTSTAGWHVGKWPQLQTRRGGHACSEIDGQVVIAGGGGDSEQTSSTEVLNLATRKIRWAGNMNMPRNGFHIVTITTGQFKRALALAGSDYIYHLNSVEEFDPETLTWTPATTNLAEKRKDFGAVSITRNLVCQV